MPNIISRLISQNPNKTTLNLFSSKFRTKYFPLTSVLQRKINIVTSKFTDNDYNITGVYHHTINANKDDDTTKIIETITQTISSHKDSLFFLTEKSQILRRRDANDYLPLQHHELTNYGLMLDLARKQWLRPDGGHTCMALTDATGSIIDDSQISLRPNKKSIINGTGVLHPAIFRQKFPNSVKHARHTMIGDEIEILASKMKKDSSTTADLTVIPISQSILSLSDILQNIKSARAIKLYNLCTSIVKENDINKIDDIIIRNYVEELKTRAATIPELQYITESESEVVLAALACTHAIIKACYGNLDAVDRKIGSDQTTQTAVVYCTVALIGTQKFFEFAKQINFYDEVSHLTKSGG